MLSLLLLLLCGPRSLHAHGVRNQVKIVTAYRLCEIIAGYERVKYTFTG